ncbi:MAG: hypothetical protein IK058_00195 [Bacteroidales bacterium]|nr:hypothetical protein [Bacteroidales bacterium]
MKNTFKVLMLAAAMALTGCTSATADLLIGSWRLDQATETVTTADSTVTHPREGYDNFRLEIMEEGVCAMIDRGDTVFYLWDLSGDDTLVLYRQGWAEDYTIDELTKHRLVYSDSYSVHDSVTGRRTDYTYTFDYSK